MATTTVTYKSGFKAADGTLWTVVLTDTVDYSEEVLPGLPDNDDYIDTSESDNRDIQPTETVYLAMDGDTPAVLELDNEDFIYTPVRQGRLRLAFAGKAAPFPLTLKQTQCTLYKDGAEYWKGYVDMDSRSQDYAPNSTYEVECSAGTTILESLDFDMGETGTTDLWTALWTAAERTGLGSIAFVFPKVYTLATSFVQPREFLQRLGLQNAKFYDDDGEGSPWSNVVEAICKFLHWTLCDLGTEWHFVDADNHGGTYTRYESSEGDGTDYTPEAIDMQPGSGKAAGISYGGNSHQVDKVRGYGKFSVTCEAEEDGGNGSDELEAGLWGLERTGDVDHEVAADNYASWTEYLASDEDSRRLMRFFVITEDGGAKGGLTLQTRRFSVSSEDSSAIVEVPIGDIYISSLTTRQGWDELLQMNSISRTDRYVYGAVPMLIAEYRHERDEDSEEWSTYELDFTTTVRILVNKAYKSSSHIGDRGWLDYPYRLVNADMSPAIWKSPYLAIPQTSTGPRTWLLDIRFDAAAYTINWVYYGGSSDDITQTTAATVYMSVRIAGKWYNPENSQGSRWVTTDTPPRFACNFTAEMDGTVISKAELTPLIKSPLQLTTDIEGRYFLDGMDNIQGFPIDLVDAPEYGEVEVMIRDVRFYKEGSRVEGNYNTDNLCLDITNFSLAFVKSTVKDNDDLKIDGSYESDLQEEQDGDSGEGEWTRGAGEELEAVDQELTSLDADKGATGTTVVIVDETDGLTNFAHIVLDRKKPEEMLLDRLETHYDHARRIWELETVEADTPPCGAWKMGTKQCILAGYEKDLRAATQTIRLEEL